jgi:site-specific DNA recombinase
MSEHYRKEIGRRTRRGLEGRALRNLPVGGRAYGYIAARDGATKQVEVHAEHAAVLLRIFELYASGKTPRQIAQVLNAERIPSPGATWRRSDEGENGKRRDGKWVASAIHGDVTRGTGILNNPRYVGRVIWGRTRWQHSAADSSVRLSRPSTQQVIEHIDKRLRIVPDDLWQRVKARQKAVHVASESVRNALRSHRGRPTRNLLSGLLRCEACDSNYVRINQREYRCATHTNGGEAACANGFKLTLPSASAIGWRHRARRATTATSPPSCACCRKRPANIERWSARCATRATC